MISAERRRHVLAVAASLAVHASTLVALQPRRNDDLAAAPVAETVLEVAWWAGDEGQSAAAAAPPTIEASPPAVDPPLSVASRSPAREERSADPPEPPAVGATSTTIPPPPAPDVEKRHAPRAAEPRREKAALGPRPADHRRPSPSRKPVAEHPDRNVPTDGEPSATPSAIRNGRPGTPGPRAVGGSVSDLAAYLTHVRARIASHQSARGGEQGRVGIRFDVAGDGRFSDLAVVAGDRGPLADEALRIVRRASPAPPIPPTLGRDAIAVNVTIVFE